MTELNLTRCTMKTIRQSKLEDQWEITLEDDDDDDESNDDAIRSLKCV